MKQYYQSRPAGREARDSDTPKTRVCLNCKTKFSSEWSGERICSQCKRKSSWRNG